MSSPRSSDRRSRSWGAAGVMMIPIPRAGVLMKQAEECSKTEGFNMPEAIDSAEN